MPRVAQAGIVSTAQKLAEDAARYVANHAATQKLEHALKSAVCGLRFDYFASEGAFPYGVFVAPEKSSRLDEAGFRKALRIPSDRSITSFSTHEFFRAMTALGEEAWNVRPAVREQYAALQRLMESHLIDLGIFVVGQGSERDVYLCGRTTSGSIIGLSSKVWGGDTFHPPANG